VEPLAGGLIALLSRNNSNLALDVQRTLLVKQSPDLSSVSFTTPPIGSTPLCSNQVTRRRLLEEVPTLDKIGIVA
jgi:hypothetical protein